MESLYKTSYWIKKDGNLKRDKDGYAHEFGLNELLLDSGGVCYETRFWVKGSRTGFPICNYRACDDQRIGMTREELKELGYD